MLFAKRLLIKSFIVAILGFFTANGLWAQWELVLEKDSVQVYNKPSFDGYSYYKAKAYINAPIESVVDFLTDIESFPQWVNNCSTSTVISRTNKDIIYRAIYDMPWPVSNRYSISHLTIFIKDESNYEFKTVPIQIDSLKLQDAILISRFKEQLTLKQTESNLIIIEMYGAYDPGGAIPSWLTDKFMKYGPYDMILKIREAVE